MSWAKEYFSNENAAGKKEVEERWEHVDEWWIYSLHYFVGLEFLPSNEVDNL